MRQLHMHDVEAPSTLKSEVSLVAADTSAQLPLPATQTNDPCFCCSFLKLI